MIHQNLKEKKKVDNKDGIKSGKDSSSKQLERIEEKKHKQKAMSWKAFSIQANHTPL